MKKAILPNKKAKSARIKRLQKEARIAKSGVLRKKAHASSRNKRIQGERDARQ